VYSEAYSRGMSVSERQRKDGAEALKLGTSLTDIPRP